MINVLKYHISQNKGEITIIPKAREPKYCIIWLHGLGDSANGFLDYFGATGSPMPNSFKVRLLTAPVSQVSINGGMPSTSWFDILSLNASPSSYSKEEVDKNSANIQQIIDEEVATFSAKNVFLGGFSQGCAMAIHNCFNSKHKLGGVVGLSGFLFFESNIEGEFPPALIIHGDEDAVLPFETSIESYRREAFLEKSQVEFHKIQGLGHGLDNRVTTLFKAWIAKQIEQN